MREFAPVVLFSHGVPSIVLSTMMGLASSICSLGVLEDGACCHIVKEIAEPYATEEIKALL